MAQILFARSQLDVPHAVGDVEAALGEEPAGWLPDLIDRVGKASTDLLLGRMTNRGGHCRFHRRYEVQIHHAVQLGKSMVWPMSWRSSSSSAIFPTAEIDLEVTPRSPTLTGLDLRAYFTRASDGTAKRPDPDLVQSAERYIQRISDQVVAVVGQRVAL